MNTHTRHNKTINLEEVWDQVPPDYYQKGVANNFLQRTWHMNKLREVLNIIRSSGIKPKNLLDVGCASGWFLSRLALEYPTTRCIGLDVYEKAVEYGKKRYKHLKLVHADAHKIPFSDNSFDVVTCTEVLEHVIGPEKVLREIKRVLKPGGIAIIEMDTGNFLFSFIWYLWSHLRNGVWKDAHIHAFSTQKLEEMIIKCGFGIKKKKVFNFSMAVVFSLRKKDR